MDGEERNFRGHGAGEFAFGPADAETDMQVQQGKGTKKND